MTEDEAKTKWCPYVRYSVVATYNAVDLVDNRPANGKSGNDGCCIGSACMAWEFDRVLSKRETGGKVTVGKSARSGSCKMFGW